MRFSLALLLYSLMHLQTAWCGDVILKIGANSIQAAVASTPQSREQGLMQTKYLCENCGMLFVFPKPGKHSFWMKNTHLPLSIAFIAKDGRILNIDEMQALSTQTHTAQGDALYALEMNKRWFDRHAIKPHSFVQGLQPIPHGE
jgi:hypothetical protein